MKHRILGSLAGLVSLLVTTILPYTAEAISPDLRKQLAREEDRTTQVEYLPDHYSFSKDVSTIEDCFNYNTKKFSDYSIENNFENRDNLGQELIAYAQNMDSITTQGNEPQQFEFLLDGMQIYAQYLVTIGNAPTDPQKGQQLLSAIQEARTTLEDFYTLQTQLAQDDSALQQYVSNLDSNSLNQRQQKQLFQRLFTLDNNPQLQTQIATILKQSFENLPADRIGIIGVDDIPYATTDNRVAQLSVMGVDIQDTNRKLLSTGPVGVIDRELVIERGFYRLTPDSLRQAGINPDEITRGDETGVVYVLGKATTTNFLFSLYQQLPENPNQQQRLLVSYMFSGIDPDNVSGQVNKPRNRGKSVVLSFVPMGFDTTVEVLHPTSEKYSTATLYMVPEMEQGIEDYILPEEGILQEDLEQIQTSLNQYDSDFTDYVSDLLPKLEQSLVEGSTLEYGLSDYATEEQHQSTE